MSKLDVKRTAKVTALAFATIVLLWSIVLAVGGQALMNWIMWAHFISVPITVQPFSVVAIVASLVYHAVVGAVFGAVFATVWNKIQ